MLKSLVLVYDILLRPLFCGVYTCMYVQRSIPQYLGKRIGKGFLSQDSFDITQICGPFA